MINIPGALFILEHIIQKVFDFRRRTAHLLCKLLILLHDIKHDVLMIKLVLKFIFLILPIYFDYLSIPLFNILLKNFDFLFG